MTLAPFVLSLLCFAIGDARQTTAPAAVGYVLSFEGPWQLDGRDVKRGEGVPANARLVLASSARFDTGRDYSLHIVLLNNQVVKCESAETCRAGVAVPASLNQNASLGDRLSKVWARIFERPERWVGLVSRSAPSRLDLTDQVIDVKENRFPIGALLDTVAPGRYRLTFTPVVDAAAAGTPVVVPVDWNGRPLAMRIAIPHGLYTVTVAPDTRNAVPGREAWILIADGDRARIAADAFADARALTRTWGTDVAPNDVARFLHAYLAEIAAAIR
jgi:hypothetical protein